MNCLYIALGKIIKTGGGVETLLPWRCIENLPQKQWEINTGTCLPTYPASYSEILRHVYQHIQQFTQKHWYTSTNLTSKLLRNTGTCLPTYPASYSETLRHVYQLIQQVTPKHCDMSTNLFSKLLRNTGTYLPTYPASYSETQGHIYQLIQQVTQKHSDRLQNKYTNCKEVTNNTNFGQITGIQEKPDTACKLNASQ